MIAGRLLVVEDEQKLARLLYDYFNKENYHVTIINRGDTVVDWVKHNEVDLILLDIMLPGIDGMAVCKALRSFTDIPILMLTARVEEIDRLLGLDAGADDYICKPFSPREVVARVKANLRRANGEVVNSAEMRLDPSRFEFKYNGVAVALTAAEFFMMSKLWSDSGRIYSRTQLMEGMYADNRIVSERTIDSHVKKLRAKLKKSFPQQEFIESVYGIGYRISSQAG